MATISRLGLIFSTILFLVSCNNSEPIRYESYPIRQIFIHHSNQAPSQKIEEDKPIIINNLDDYTNLINDWKIQDSPITFNPSESSLLIVVRKIDYDILSEHVKILLSTDNNGIISVSYNLSDGLITEQAFFEIIICCVDKISPNTRFSFTSEISH